MFVNVRQTLKLTRKMKMYSRRVFERGDFGGGGVNLGGIILSW